MKMSAVQLIKSYCVPILTYACEMWQLSASEYNAINQWCSGAGMRRNAVPVNIFLPERHYGKNLLSQPER